MAGRTLAHLIGILLSASLALSCGGGADDGGSPAGGNGRISLGYYTEYQGVDYSYRSVVSYRGHLTAISADTFTVDAGGGVHGRIGNTEIMGFCRDHGIQVYACISNYSSVGFDRDLGHAALVTSKIPLIDSLADLVQDGGFDGVNIDFENLDPGDRTAYSRFVHDLALRLHGIGKTLVLSVPAKAADDPSASWSGAFDYSAIGEEADLLQVMTYDQHGPGWSDPGPVAGFGWVRNCLAFAVSQVAPEKLLIGLPAYGYDWKRLPDGTWTEGTGSFSWKDRPTEGVQWDAGSLSPFAVYIDGGGVTHQAWFESADSIRAKTVLVNTYGLGGISMWSLGQEDHGFWQAAEDGLP